MVRFTVTILRKGQHLKKIFQQDSFSIGRSLDCDLSLDDLGVSRVQLVVSRQGSQIWIEDRSSSNGTFLNHTRIVQNKPVNVVPTDSIQLGKSSYLISIDLEIDDVLDYLAEDLAETLPEPTPSVGADVEPALVLMNEILTEERNADPILTEKEVLVMPFVTVEEEPAKAVEKPVAMQAPKVATVVTPDSLVQEARRQAAQIIYEGEAQAEKRVQTIYRKAQDAQAESELVAQEKLQKAQQQAEDILIEHQNQGQALLQEARAMAQELREEVEVYVEGLKEKVKRESETALKSAFDKAEAESSAYVIKAQEEADRRSALSINQAEQEAHDLVHFAQMQAEEFKNSNEEALKQSEISQKESARLSEELQKIKIDFAQEEARKEALLADIKKDEENISQLIKDLSELKAEKGQMDGEFRLLQQKEADLQRALENLNEQTVQGQKIWEGKKSELEKSLAFAKQKAEKEAAEYSQHLKLELNKKSQILEEELFRSLVEKRNSLSKDILHIVEKQVVQIAEPARWMTVYQSTNDMIQEVIESKLVTFSQAAAENKTVNLKTKKRSEAFRWVTVGTACGVLGFFLSNKMYMALNQDQTLVQRQLASEAQARQEDLQKRKFNPVQSAELKDSYTDAVLYTKNYTNHYLSPVFQEKFFKAAAHYLLKTWRVDEEHSMQAVSAAAALVKELSEKREGIHPDFVKDGIQKMRQLEQQNVARLKEILGSEVRLESFRKFERKFYGENALERLDAAR